MILMKCFLLSMLFFSPHSIAKMAADSSSAFVDTSEMANTQGPSSPGARYDGISSTNRMLAQAAYGASLISSLATLVVFFIARRNVKADYKKAKKFFMIGLGLFVLAIALFLLAKLVFLSYSGPGNFDIRAT